MVTIGSGSLYLKSNSVMDGGQCVASMDTVGLADLTVDGKDNDLVPCSRFHVTDKDRFSWNLELDPVT